MHTVTRRSSPGVRTVAAVALSLAAALALGGCAASFDDIGIKNNTPASGVDASLGDVGVRAATLVASEDGGPAVLVGSVVNTGHRADALVQARLKGSSEPATIEGGRVRVPGARAVPLDAGAGPMVTLTGPARSLQIGTFVTVRLTFRDAGTLTTHLLVQSPSGAYASVTPPAAAVTGPTPTPGVTPGTSASPGATGAAPTSAPTPTPTSGG